MVQNTMTTQQYLYIDYNTSNKSFRDMYEFLKDIGIKNNSFFLVLLDPDLVGVNPRDPRLNRMMKTKIFQTLKMKLKEFFQIWKKKYFKVT